MKKYISCVEIAPMLDKWPLKILANALDKFLAVDWFNNEIDKAMKKYNGDFFAVCSHFANDIGINVIFEGKHIIPTSGPLQVISNHGGEILDAILLFACLTPIRKDIKFIATSKIKPHKLYSDFCFYSEPTIHNYQLISNYLSKGNMLCHFAISLPKAVKKNQSGKIQYHKPLSPLPYILQKKSLAPILPITIKFEKTFLGKVFLSLEKKLLALGLNALAYFFMIIDSLFALRTLRAMQGKTATVTIGALITAAPEKLSRSEATKWVARLLGLKVLEE